MIPKEAVISIEQEVHKIFHGLEVQGNVTVEVNEEEKALYINVRTEEPKLLIGERGQTLFEIQHIIKLLVHRKVEATEEYYISLDINEYRKNKEDYLRELATTTADEVSLLRRPKELSPMSSSERRIIHAALSDRTDVVSESVGDGPTRHIVVRLKD